MAKYRVYAESVSAVYVDIEADNYDDAYRIAKEMDGGEFIEDVAGGRWDMDPEWVYKLDENGKVVG